MHKLEQRVDKHKLRADTLTFQSLANKCNLSWFFITEMEVYSKIEYRLLTVTVTNSEFDHNNSESKHRFH